jgi:hypothetical protein
MDIYDEQPPFTKEQADYLAANYVKKTIVRSGQNVARSVEHENNLAALNFLRRLTLEGGEIVCSAGCSSFEIALANKEDRFFVDADGLGYVFRPTGWEPLPIDARSLN